LKTWVPNLQAHNRAEPDPISAQDPPLRLLPYYTGDQTLEAALKHPADLRLLWLEILLNDDFPWDSYRHLPKVEAAYEKACLWYGHYKTMIDGHIGRAPLEAKTGKIDEKEIRTFQEALNFASA